MNDDSISSQLEAAGLPIQGYQEDPLGQFARDLEGFQPRAFDTYVLPAFLVLYAVRSKNAVGRWPRRILFTAGLYMFYRNFTEYRELIASIRENITQAQKGAVT
jgi:hypothetical protein